MRISDWSSDVCSSDLTGAAVVVIEHDMAVIETLAAPVAVMMTGRIVALGGYAEVRRDPAVREGSFGTVLSVAEKAPAVDCGSAAARGREGVSRLWHRHCCARPPANGDPRGGGGGFGT